MTPLLSTDFKMTQNSGGLCTEDLQGEFRSLKTIMSPLQGWLQELICHSDMLKEISWKSWWQEHELDLLRFKISKSRLM